MEFKNTFSVAAPMQRVWEIMTDPREITPCVPGAEITEMIDDRHFKGMVRVKLGAVQMSYRGDMEMQPDEADHSILLQGKGTEARGSGGASGKVTVTLSPSESGGTDVNILSQVDVTGRVATFGRGIMQDVATRLIREFARCLEQKITTPSSPEAAADEGQPSGTGAAAAGPGSEATAGSPSASTDVSAPAPTAAPQPGAPEHTPPSGTAATGGTTPGAPGPAAGQADPATALSSPPTTSGTASAPPAVGVGSLIGDILRSRIAEGLRTLAAKIEPR